ncbi:SNF2-related and DNA RNA helicase domain containing protein [Aphelenchoides besseyi]|nr:SNF2-related and DNA RNA helicase domain containing protein [Aphelenchoides besseyi]
MTTPVVVSVCELSFFSQSVYFITTFDVVKLDDSSERDRQIEMSFMLNTKLKIKELGSKIAAENDERKRLSGDDVNMEVIENRPSTSTDKSTSLSPLLPKSPSTPKLSVRNLSPTDRQSTETPKRSKSSILKHRSPKRMEKMKLEEDSETTEDAEPTLLQVNVPTSPLTPMSYAPVSVRPSSVASNSAQQSPVSVELKNKEIEVETIDEDTVDEEDDIVFVEEVVSKKKKSIEVVELSSDDSETEATQFALAKRRLQPAYIRNFNPSKMAIREEQKRTKRMRRKNCNLESMELTAEGRLLVNDGKPPEDPDVFVSPYLTSVLQPHQYDNVIESLHDFIPNIGLGCILAHSMGLGKTIQVIAFTEIFLRVTPCKRVLIICPINVIQNWYSEYEKWLPIREGKRDFKVFLLGDTTKTRKSRADLVSDWEKEGGVLLLGYEMFRLLACNRRSNKREEDPEDSNEQLSKIFHRALLDPGPDLVVCDEGHKIKNLKADTSLALSKIRTNRRIVLTGYPLQNNLLEYFCMIDFVRPSYLGTKKEFMIMFDRPIRNGMCIDSTRQDVRVAQQRTHVLIELVRGFVQRRTQLLLKAILPESKEYVVLIRKSPVQRNLYKEFVKFVRDELSGANRAFYNPLKAHAICSKIWNHPDLLYRAWMFQLQNMDYSGMIEQMTQANPSFSQMSSSLFDAPPNPQQYVPYMNGNQSNNLGTYNLTINNNGYGSQQNQWNEFQPQQQWFNGQSIMQNGNQFSNQQNFGYQQQQSSSLSNGLSMNEPQPSTSKTKNGAKKKPAKKKRKGTDILDEDDEGADPVMETYTEGILEHSNKMQIALKIIEATVMRGEKILLFSGSLITLSLIEDFLKQREPFELPNGEKFSWQRGKTYFRFDGSTSATDREKLIDRFNADPTVRLFLISTRAGSLVSANRVIIFDCSWNPSHDAQAVCRIYRYGQQCKTYIYRLITHNCMERAIFARQISKQGLQQRVVDENFVDAKVTQRELENLIAFDEVLEMDIGEVDTREWKIEDDLLKTIVNENPSMFAECPFLHESLMLEQEETLSAEEKMEAQLLYDHEKRRILMGAQMEENQRASSTSNLLQGPMARLPGTTFGFQQPAPGSSLYQHPNSNFQQQPNYFPHSQFQSQFQPQFQPQQPNFRPPQQQQQQWYGMQQQQHIPQPNRQPPPQLYHNSFFSGLSQ